MLTAGEVGIEKTERTVHHQLPTAAKEEEKIATLVDPTAQGETLMSVSA